MPTALRSLFLVAALALPAAHAEDPSAGPPVSLALAEAAVSDVRARVESWTEAEQAEALEAAQVLLVSCPYNRTAAQLPQALLQTVGTLERAGLSPEQREELRRLQEGLARHHALVERAMGGELPAPALVDPLDALPVALLPSREELAGDEGPIGRTKALVDVIPEGVGAMPSDVSARIGAASERLARLTGNAETRPGELLADDAWPFTRPLQGWHTGLAALLPHLSDAEERRQVAAAVELLDIYLKSRC